jgi:hypothetical protein
MKKIRVLLTRAPGALVKKLKEKENKSFWIENTKI